MITKTSPNSKFPVKSLLIALYVCFLLPIAIFAFRRPDYNWDMLAYMALIVKTEHKDPQLIHQITYSVAKENIPAEQYNLLLSSDYRKKMADNPTGFYRQLPAYAVKPLYLLVVYAFHKAGFSLPLSTVLPSIVSYVIIGMFLFYWLAKYLEHLVAFIAGLLIMYSDFMVNMSKLSTPDCLSAFVLLAAFYFIIEKPSLRWMTIFLILSVFARIDNIIACFLIVSFLFFIKKSTILISRKQYLLVLTILAVCYFGITFLLRSYGWGILYYRGFSLQQLNLGRENNSVFSLKNYIAFAVSKAITGIVAFRFTFFMLLLLLVLYTPSLRIKQFGFDQLFCLLFPLIIIIRFLLMPELSDRFYIAYYLCIVILLIKRYASLLSKTNS